MFLSNVKMRTIRTTDRWNSNWYKSRLLNRWMNTRNWERKRQWRRKNWFLWRQISIIFLSKTCESKQINLSRMKQLLKWEKFNLRISCNTPLHRVWIWIECGIARARQWWMVPFHMSQQTLTNRVQFIKFDFWDSLIQLLGRIVDFWRNRRTVDSAIGSCGARVRAEYWCCRACRACHRSRQATYEPYTIRVEYVKSKTIFHEANAVEKK